MNRSFLVPAAIACSAHALLMFGFTKPESRPVEKPTVCPVEPYKCVDVVIEEPEKPLEPIVGEALPVMKSSIVPPSSPEMPPLSGDNSGFLMRLETWVNRVDSGMNIIPTGPIYPASNSGGIGGPGTERGIVYPAANLDETPRARSQTPPAYPFALKSAGISGEVLVEFVVDESGRVLNPRVLRSSHPEFEAPTLAAVSRWRFEPGTRNALPVKFMMRLPLTFSLNE
jgi:periplasmic protein TonB